jgi:hypothetical protein
MRKAQLIAALSGLALLLALGAPRALAADEAKDTPKDTAKKVEKKKGQKRAHRHHRYRGVITAVEQDKDGKVTSFTVALRHHKKKNGTAVAREMKFNLDGATKFRARGKLKRDFDASKLAKGERVRIIASGDHADKVFVKKMHTAKKDHARAKKVKNARAARPAK